jgi:hypothetical protein
LRLVDWPIFRDRRLAAGIDVLGFWLAPVLLGLSGAFLLGPDANWDLANYHYYNPWALLNGRFDYDVVPAGEFQNFINPLIDVPFYWANNHLPGRLIAFCLALVQGLAISAIYRMARRLLFPRPLAGEALAALAVSFVSIAGGYSLLEIGTTFYDYVGATATAICLALLMPRDVGAATPSAPRMSRTALAGFVIGSAAGLKATNIFAPVAIALALPLLVMHTRGATRVIIVFIAAEIAGALAFGGGWAWFLWHHFESPVFPLLNGIFHSPFAPRCDLSIHEMRHTPHGWWEWLFFPFVVLFEPQHGGVYLWHGDPRLASLFIAVPVGLLLLAVTRDGHPSERRTRRRFLLFLLAALGLGYLLWLILFAYQRYALLLEVMAPLACVLVVAELPWPRWRVPIGAAVLIGLVSTFSVVSWPRGEWSKAGGQIVHATLPDIGLRGDELILMRRRPESFLAPWFPAGTRFVQFSPLLSGRELLRKFEPKAACLLAKQQGRIFVLMSSAAFQTPWTKAPFLETYGLRMSASECREIGSTIQPDGPYQLCPVHRVAPPDQGACGPASIRPIPAAAPEECPLPAE